MSTLIFYCYIPDTLCEKHDQADKLSYSSSTNCFVNYQHHDTYFEELELLESRMDRNAHIKTEERITDFLASEYATHRSAGGDIKWSLGILNNDQSIELTDWKKKIDGFLFGGYLHIKKLPNISLCPDSEEYEICGHSYEECPFGLDGLTVDRDNYSRKIISVKDRQNAKYQTTSVDL